MDSRQKLQARFSLIYVVGAILAVLLLQEYLIAPMMAGEEEVPYSRFRQDLATGAIAEVSVEPERIVYTMSESGEEAGEAVKTRKAVRIEDEDLVGELVEAGVEFQARAPTKGLLESLFGWILPVLPFVVIWWFLMKRMGKGAGGMLSIGKSKATEISGEMTNVTFADVGGAEQVEVELKEIIEFLNHPERFVAVGAKLPKGYPARGSARHRKNAPRQGHGRRSRCALLLDQRIGVCGDVCGGGRFEGARPLRSGEGESTRHHLYR